MGQMDRPFLSEAVDWYGRDRHKNVLHAIRQHIRITSYAESNSRQSEDRLEIH
jgi:hypothetical protein